MIALVYAYTILVTVYDLLGAVLYAQGDLGLDGLLALRLLRDGLAVVLCGWGLVKAKSNVPSILAISGYALFILAYVAGADGSRDLALVVAAAMKLAIPPILVLAGLGALRSEPALGRYAMLLALLSCSSAAFGAWDIRHTEFWTDFAEYGYYLHDFKGILTGYTDRWVLPFNFFGFEDQRRAAGLVAAPLAQGTLLVTGCILGFAVLNRRALPLALAVLAIGGLGVWQSGTRGALLMGLLALPILLLGGGATRGGVLRSVAILFLALAFSYQTLINVYSYSASFEDGSSIGHVDALKQNIADLGEVVFAGKGIGAAGSAPADIGLEVAGGGEGALFSVIYQMGIPGGLAFLVFYGVCAVMALRRARLPGVAGDVALAVFALAVGLSTSMILSEHIFSLSATAGFWIALGGVIGYRPEAATKPGAP
ncbi:MAG: hypothetical protein WCO00_14975 [Rhodospirillaceae bacterium]